MKIIFFLTTAIILIGQWMGLFASVSRSSTDFLFTASRTKNTAISLVAIDDVSLTTIGRWPWSRETQAKLLRVISEGKPKVIGYDIVVDDPTESRADAAFQMTVRDIRSVVLPAKDAHVTVDIDGDGVVRRFPCTGSFALSVAKRWNADVFCPADRLIVNYRFDPKSLPVFSASDVLSGKQIPTTPIVLVGITSPSLQDMRRTPLTHTLLPGVFIHINAIDTFVSGRTLVEASKMMYLLGTSLFLMSFAFVLWRLKYVWGLLLLIVWGMVPVVMAIVGYARGVRIDIWYMEVGLVVTYAAQLAAEYLSEWHKRRFVTQAFGKYLSPHIVNAIIAHPNRLTLGGETRRISVFFSDIRSFTTLSESMEPKALVALLNTFLSFATTRILDGDGTVDKYIGDAIVAFWNAPMDQVDHAVRTAKAAIAIRDGMDRFDRLAIGIGLHTGDALVGNVGSSNRLSYTAIGDTVNTASRLEGVTKQYGVPIACSQSFFDEVNRVSPGAVVFRKLDTVILKGKKLPLVIYELVGVTGLVDPVTQKKIDQYAKGLMLYERGTFHEAKEVLSHPILKGDMPARVIIDRCKAFLKHKPSSWNGVSELLSK
ncbi:MAG: adenylate/guanylate cyclase domain-containing protein [Candidatus Gottesmanbacteria bacterium]|nr:adenylate/guanylate cyclase domain-containing protein [Candidatus Gottesmanbacteria bacterium]